jgi:AcrR family transcriptional regulator
MASSVQQAQQTDPQPKRTAILEAALDRFADLGVNGVAVPDIADARDARWRMCACEQR